ALTFQLVVNDGQANSAAATVNVLVKHLNRAPVASAGPTQTVAERTAVTLDATGSTDADGDALTYSWTQAGGPSVALAGAATAHPTFTTPQVTGTQTFVFQVVASDGQAISVPATVSVSVTHVNRAPVASAAS